VGFTILRLMKSVPLSLGLALLAAAVPASASERLTVEVRETAGIRRFSYPAGVLLELPRAVPADTAFRLLDGAAPVAAQFRPAASGSEVSSWRLDWNVSLPPHEARAYTVEYGRDVPPGPKAPRGLELEVGKEVFRVANPPHLSWEVPRVLTGLLRSVRTPELDYVRPDGAGLLLRDRVGGRHRLGATTETVAAAAAAGGAAGGDTKATVVREGPLAIVLRFERVEADARLAGVKSTVDLEFSVAKSWVLVSWTVDDPQGNVSSLGAELQLGLQEPSREAPAMADLGAATLVYAALGPGEEAELRAAPAGTWEVRRGARDWLEPFVAGPVEAGGARAEGWAHLMDRRMCLALGVEDFARETHDRIRLAAGGLVTVWREFTPSGAGPRAGRKSLRLGLHFVPYPPHVTAATSPQSMQAGLEVRVRG